MVSRNWERNEEAGSNEGTFPPGCLLLGKTFHNTLEVSLASFQTRSFPSQRKIFPLSSQSNISFFFLICDVFVCLFF